MKMTRKALALCAAAIITLSTAGNCFAAEWLDTDSGKKYLDDNGTAVTGMQEIDGNTYYFSSKGIMKTGWLTTKSGKKYYFGSDGVMKKGWLKTKSGKKYYFGNNGAVSVGETKINGVYYYFDDDGVMLTGWQGDYYYRENGKRAVRCTLAIDGKKVTFDKKGKKTREKTIEPANTSSPVTVTETKPAEPAQKKADSVGITVRTDKITLNDDETEYIIYDIWPIDAPDKSVTFKTSNYSVAGVDQDGKVTARGKGSATITISGSGGATATVSVTVVA